MTDSNSSRTLAVSPADGPVAVTGASGYVGSWIVRELVEQGYTVRSCVRDPSDPEKVDHLLAMNDAGLRGSNTLFTADLFRRGSYDAAFDGCCGVMHAGAILTRSGATPQQVYDGCFTVVEHVIESVRRAGTVRRLILTSSFSAVSHPAHEGYVYTEKDWCTDNIEARPSDWSEENIPYNRHAAYAYGKARAEEAIYKAAEDDGRFESMSILPLNVIGPVMCANHDEGGWQVWIRRMLQGEPFTLTPGGANALEQRRRSRCRAGASTVRREHRRAERVTLHPCREGSGGRTLHLAVAGEVEGTVPANPEHRRRGDGWREAGGENLRQATILLHAREAGTRPHAVSHRRDAQSDGRILRAAWHPTGARLIV